MKNMMVNTVNLSNPAPILRVSTSDLSKLFFIFKTLRSLANLVIRTNLYTFPIRVNRANLFIFPDSNIESNGITAMMSKTSQDLRYFYEIFYIKFKKS
jgi:hypothetical protein